MPTTRVLQNTGKISKGNFEGKFYTHTEVRSETDMAESNWRKSNHARSNQGFAFQDRYSFPLTSHEDSEGGRNVGLPSLLRHLAQLGLQSCQLWAPAPLYPQGNPLVLTSVRGSAVPRDTECRQTDRRNGHWKKHMKKTA